MVRPSMSRFFKRTRIKFSPEITPGVCPHCDMQTSFISIVNDYYRCMTCGDEVQQRVNGVIKYLPIGQDKNNRRRRTWRVRENLYLEFVTTRKSPRNVDLNATQKGPINAINVKNHAVRAENVFYEIYSSDPTFKHKRNRHRKSQTQA